ncbi:unnamed protein product [Ixodes pacificus]
MPINRQQDQQSTIFQYSVCSAAMLHAIALLVFSEGYILPIKLRQTLRRVSKHKCRYIFI